MYLPCSTQNLNTRRQPLQRPHRAGTGRTDGAIWLGDRAAQGYQRKADSDVHDPDRDSLKPPKRPRHPHEARQDTLAGPGHRVRETSGLHQCRDAAVQLHTVALVDEWSCTRSNRGQTHFVTL